MKIYLIGKKFFFNENCLVLTFHGNLGIGGGKFCNKTAPVTKYLEKISMISIIAPPPSTPYNGLQRQTYFLTTYSLAIKNHNRNEFILSNLSTGPAMMPSPGQSKFTCADHTHCGSGIRNPDGSL